MKMSKEKLSPQALLGPVPAALISCGNAAGKHNIITLAWVGVVNSLPPMVSISIRPSRLSHGMIAETGEFVINLCAGGQVELADRCGTVSGREVDKFRSFGLTAVQGSLEYAPMIEECPVNLECMVEQTVELPSHTLFIGKVIAAYAGKGILGEGGRINYNEWQPLGFCNGKYLASSSLDLSLGCSLKNR